jgi:hypothetical protein
MYVCRYEWLPMMRAEAAPAAQPIIRNETLAVDLVCAWVRWFLGATSLCALKLLVFEALSY